MKALSDLDYEELHARAVQAARLPALDGDGGDYAGLDVLDAETGSGYGQVAVTSDEWLRQRANLYLSGLPDAPRPVDALRRLSDDEREIVLVEALREIDLERASRHLRAFDPGKHKRWPKGHPSAGKFRPMIDLLKAAIAAFDPKKDKHPFELFSRPQLLKAAKARGIKLDRGEDESSIAVKLHADLDPNTKASTPAVKKAAPVKKAAAGAKAVKAAAKPAGPDDGLDALDEHRLRSLAYEWDVLEPGKNITKTRDEIIEQLRALGALAPDVTLRRNDERKDLLERLKNMGRREPADNGPLERAVIALSEDVDRKTVAKQLRKEADSVGRKEDADTLRFLASDLARKKAGPPPYINDRGRIDLVKLAEHHGVDIRKWMPLDKVPRQGTAMFDYQRDNPFDWYFRRFAEDLGNPRKPTSRATAVRQAREYLSSLRQSMADANAGVGVFAWGSRKSDRKHFIARGLDVAADLDQLIGLAEAAKVPAAKRAPTLGATSLGEIVPVDETRFKPRRLKEVLSHRGEHIPDGFKHTGSGTELVRNPMAPKRPGLNDAENRALDLWTLGVVADGLNGSLRRGRNVHGVIKGPTGKIDLDETLRDVRAAIADSHLTQDTELWRGALVSKADFRRLVPGALYTDLGLLATSTEEMGARHTIAWRQSNGSVPSGRVPVLFRILAPAGTNAALGHERVKEVVLPDGQELRVVRVDESVSPPIAVMEVVPPQRDPGVVRGRSIVDDFDYDAATVGPSGSHFSKGVPDTWLGAIQKAQGFDGKPKVVTRQEMDEAVRDGATQVFRAVSQTDGGKTPAELAEQYRRGDLYPGTGVYGNGTYATPQREVAVKYGDEKTMLRIALRRDARVISIEDLNKLRSRTGITATASKMADDRQAELNRVDPKDTAAVKAIMDKYEKLAERQGSRSRVAQDLGRVAALLGYDAIYVPNDYRGTAAKFDDQTEYVILNRTATIVEEAQL